LLVWCGESVTGCVRVVETIGGRVVDGWWVIASGGDVLIGGVMVGV